MARTSFVEIPAGQEELYYKIMQSGDRFVYSKMVRNITLLSRLRKAGVSQRSLLPQVAALWANLTTEEKEAWAAAAAVENAVWNSDDTTITNAFYGKAYYGLAYYGKHIYLSNLSGWRVFVKDTCLRIFNNLSVPGVPSLLHQGPFGNLHIGGSATQLKITQLHPRSYYIYRKIVGKKGQYEPLLITEDFALPLKIALNYSANLTSQGAGSFARFYALVWSSYQGVDTQTFLEIPLTFLTDWVHAEAILSTVIGQLIAYDLHIDLVDLQGDLYIDNIKAEHSSQNWCRDTFCNDINQGFTRAYAQIPEHWVAEVAPAGSFFESTYLDF